MGRTYNTLFFCCCYCCCCCWIVVYVIKATNRERELLQPIYYKKLQAIYYFMWNNAYSQKSVYSEAEWRSKQQQAAEKKRNNKEVKRWRKYPLTIVKTIKALSHYSHRIQWTQLKAIQKNRIHTLCTMLQQWNGPNKLYSALYLYGGYKNTIFRRIIVYKMRRFDGYCMGCGYGYDMKSCSCM